MKRPIRCYWPVTIAVLIVMGLGCSQQTGEELAEKALEKSLGLQGNNAKVDIEGGNLSMTVEGEDGQTKFSYGGDVGVPAGFPEDVPVYPGIEVVMATEGQNETFHIQAKSEDTIDKIADFYSRELDQRDWEKVTDTTTGKVMRTLHYRKEKRHVHVNAVGAEDGTAMLSVSTREDK